MNTNNRNPTKKRKVDESHAKATNGVSDDIKNKNNDNDGRNDDEHHANKQFMQQILSHMGRMEQMMTRMEDKLGAFNNLESRCEELEAKCTSLENKLESTMQSVKDVDRKLDSLHNNFHEKSSLVDDKIEAMNKKTHAHHEYNSMLVKNLSWKYSADILPIDQIMSETDCDYQTAVRLTKEIQEIKENTIKMRRGEFTDESNERKDISLNIYYARAQDFYRVFRPHLKEFAAALKQFTPAMNLLPDESDTMTFYSNVMLDRSGQMMLKEALIGKPFTSIRFYHNANVHGEYGGVTADDIVTIAESNKHLRKLQIVSQNSISNYITNRLCSVVNNHPLLELSLDNSINEPGVGNAILTNLFTNVELKLKNLSMISAGITSEASGVLAEFLAANPALQSLNLDTNSLNDSDAALRSNTTLSILSLSENNITYDGFELFRPVLFNESSLNAVADSNHHCYIEEFDSTVNHLADVKNDRGWKIYTLLSSIHESISNVQLFSEVDVKLLPNMLELAQRYAKLVIDYNEEIDGSDWENSARSLSIVYEIMRRWEKVFNIYES